MFPATAWGVGGHGDRPSGHAERTGCGQCLPREAEASAWHINLRWSTWDMNLCVYIYIYIHMICVYMIYASSDDIYIYIHTQ